MIYPERLETERLQLRWPEVADAEEVYARYARDPEVSLFMSWKAHESLRDTVEFLKWSVEQRQAGSSYGWLVFLRSSGQLLGSIGCRRLEPHLLQFGYCYARDAWGHGYASEAARAIVPVWLEDASVWRVQALCQPENVASARVLEKAGLKLEGTLRRYIKVPSFGDTPCDVLCYACVRDG